MIQTRRAFLASGAMALGGCAVAPSLLKAKPLPAPEADPAALSAYWFGPYVDPCPWFPVNAQHAQEYLWPWVTRRGFSAASVRHPDANGIWLVTMTGKPLHYAQRAEFLNLLYPEGFEIDGIRLANPWEPTLGEFRQRSEFRKSYAVRRWRSEVNREWAQWQPKTPSVIWSPSLNEWPRVTVSEGRA